MDSQLPTDHHSPMRILTNTTALEILTDFIYYAYNLYTVLLEEMDSRNHRWK